MERSLPNAIDFYYTAGCLIEDKDRSSRPTASTNSRRLTLVSAFGDAFQPVHADPT